MQFFDTHSHIGLIYNDPIEQIRVIQQAKQADVTRIISINNNLLDFKKEYAFLKSITGIYHAVGVSPSEVKAPGIDWQNTIVESAKLPNVVAIGEMGLDYDKKYGDKRSQIELFIQELEIAKSCNLPAIIHNRMAGDDIFEILKERIPAQGAIFHCYSEDSNYAHKCLDAGLNVYFSFAGNLTYRNAKNLHGTALNLPLDRILVESESPFLPPQEFIKKDSTKKTRTKPYMLPATARFLSELLGMDLETVSAQLWKNSCKIFNLPE